MAKEQIEYRALPVDRLQYPVRRGCRALHLTLSLALGLSLIWNALLAWSWLKSETRVASPDTYYCKTRFVRVVLA